MPQAGRQTDRHKQSQAQTDTDRHRYTQTHTGSVQIQELHALKVVDCAALVSCVPQSCSKNSCHEAWDMLDCKGSAGYLLYRAVKGHLSWLHLKEPRKWDGLIAPP